RGNRGRRRPVSWRTLIPARFGGCPAGWELSRAYLEEGRRDIDAHLDTCERCAAEWRSLGRARAIVKALPRRSMSGETYDLIETRLRLGLANPPPAAASMTEARSWRGRAVAMFLTCGVAAAAALVWARAGGPARRPPQAGTSWTSIRAVGETVFSREASSPDEIVRL